MAAEVVLAVREGAWSIVKIDMHVTHVQGFKRRPSFSRLGHFVVHLLDVVIVLNSNRLRGKNVVYNTVKVDGSNHWVGTPAKVFVADAILREQVVLNDCIHGLTKLVDELGAVGQGMTN